MITREFKYFSCNHRSRILVSEFADIDPQFFLLRFIIDKRNHIGGNAYSETDPETCRSHAALLELNKPFLLYVGQLREHKNTPRLIEAFLATGRTDWELILAGGNYLKIDFSAYPENVRYLGMVDDEVLKALYSHCTGFVFPSLIEGFGFPVLEAMSFGKPVIGTGSGAIREVGGELMMGVDPADVVDMQQKMTGFMADPERYTFSPERYRENTERFSWEACAQGVLSVYEGIYAQRKQP